MRDGQAVTRPAKNAGSAGKRDKMRDQIEAMFTVGTGEGARTIAVRMSQPASAPADLTLVWLGGYRSDMTGTKALELDTIAARLTANCLRIDYSGHGVSGGAFADGTISRWLEEALAVMTGLAPGRLILVGSSMGGWIAIRAVQELRKRGQGHRLAGLVLIAPAPDFTSELIEPELTQAQKDALARDGFFTEPSQYGPDPYIYTRALIEDGRTNAVLSGSIETGCPVTILQGMADPDVPWRHAMRLLESLPHDDVVMTLIRDGDHRLSRPADLALLSDAVTHMAAAR